MNNENNNNNISQSGINRKFFEDLIENSNLSEEDKKKIGEFKDFKNDTVGEVLKAGEKDKIKDYDKLNVKDLPAEWELKMARLKELEKHEADYLQKKAELKVWTDTFGDKKPSEVQEEIKELEQKLTKTEEEAKQKIQNLENDLDKSVQENQNILKSLGERIKELKTKLSETQTKLNEWTGFFGDRELAEVQEELEELRKRPDTTISTEEFYNNYAKRKSNEQDELDKQELEKEREKSAKLEQQNNYFLQQANRILENVRIKRYALDEPVITIEKAQEKIAKLLEEKEKELEDYLQGDNSVNWIHKELDFELSIYPEKKERAKQVLEWIKEAKTTQDYQKLFELWSGGQKYNKENDFADGSLGLLKRYLEVGEPEPAL